MPAKYQTMLSEPDVRFDAHCGLKSDIAPCPLSSHEQTCNTAEIAKRKATTKPEKQLEFKSAGSHTGKSGLDCLWSERLSGV
jgi:hypothetical protein